MTVICFVLLLCLAGKEDAGAETAALLKPFYKMAMYLYKRICRCFPGRFSSPQVEKDLRQLHPGEPAEYVKTDYYVKKGAVGLAVIFAGALLGAAARFNAESGIILGEDRSISRSGYEQGTGRNGWILR